MWTLCPPTSSPPPSRATFAATSTKQSNQLRSESIDFYWSYSLFIKLHTSRSRRWRKTGAKLQPAKNISPTTATGANKLQCSCEKAVQLDAGTERNGFLGGSGRLQG